MTETAPEFDSAAWRELRNTRLHVWLQDDAALSFVLDYADFCEVIDDLIDGDKEVTQADIVRALFAALVDLPDNPFFAENRHHLVPIIMTGINAWLDANDLEATGQKNDRVLAYTLRDQYMDIVVMCLHLTRGRDTMRELSLEVRRFFTRHESFEDYDRKLGDGK